MGEREIKIHHKFHKNYRNRLIIGNRHMGSALEYFFSQQTSKDKSFTYVKQAKPNIPGQNTIKSFTTISSIPGHILKFKTV